MTEQVMTELPYERFRFGTDFRSVIMCLRGEHILSLHPFGWHLDGSHIPNCPEHFSVDAALACTRMEPVYSYGPYLYVVRLRDSLKDWAAP